jgi:hypothetical protein
LLYTATANSAAGTLFVFEFDHLAASSLQMPHQINASSGSFLFLFKMLLEPYLLDATEVLDNERVHVSLVFGVLAR